jgi:hypothetical protein
MAGARGVVVRTYNSGSTNEREDGGTRTLRASSARWKLQKVCRSTLSRAYRMRKHRVRASPFSVSTATSSAGSFVTNAAPLPAPPATATWVRPRLRESALAHTASPSANWTALKVPPRQARTSDKRVRERTWCGSVAERFGGLRDDAALSGVHANGDVVVPA